MLFETVGTHFAWKMAGGTQLGRIWIMKKVSSLAAIAALVFFAASSLIAGKANGKAEEYHYALDLCYQHTADHAKALFNQVVNGEFNLEIAKNYADQIGSDLDHARAYHAVIHKTFTESETKATSEEHLIILGGQATAATALVNLKVELTKYKPDVTTIKTLSHVIFDAATKALNAHRDAMKKLGVREAVTPSA